MKRQITRNIASTTWTGETAREIGRRAGAEGLLVMQYLMTSPHANMLGVYRIPVGYVGAETRLGDVGASKGLRACVEAGFCSYDEDSQFVFLHEFAKWQISEQLDPKDKRCTGVQNQYDALPDNPFLGIFFDRYASAFCMRRRRAPRRGEGTPHDLFGPIPAPVEACNKQAPSKPGTGTGTGPGTGPGTPAGGGGAGGSAAAPPPAPPAPAQVDSPAPKPKATRGSRKVPESWLVSPALQQWAREECPGVDIRAETAKFRDHQFREAYTDWDGTWKNWIRKAEEIRLSRPGASRAPPPTLPGGRTAKAVLFGDDADRPLQEIAHGP